jgi:hypothetical protein
MAGSLFMRRIGHTTWALGRWARSFDNASAALMPSNCRLSAPEPGDELIRQTMC